MEKIHFADLVKDAKSVFLLPANFELVGMTSHKQGLASKYSFKTATSKVKLWASFETNFSSIAGTLEAKTSVSGNAEYSLAISEDKKSKLFGVTFSLKEPHFFPTVQHLSSTRDIRTDLPTN